MSVFRLSVKGVPYFDYWNFNPPPSVEGRSKAVSVTSFGVTLGGSVVVSREWFGTGAVTRDWTRRVIKKRQGWQQEISGSTRFGAPGSLLLTWQPETSEGYTSVIECINSLRRLQHKPAPNMTNYFGYIGRWNQVQICLLTENLFNLITKASPSLVVLLFCLMIIPINTELILKYYLLVSKALNGLGPKYISDLLLCYKAPRSLRSSGTGLLSVLRVKTKHGEAAFSFYALHIWNKLPENCKSAATLSSFITQLNTFLFATGFYWIKFDGWNLLF